MSVTARPPAGASWGGGHTPSGGSRVPEGGGRASEGGSLASLDGSRASEGGSRASLDGGRVSEGGGRASWGGSRDDPHAQARAARSAPVLLHSLTTFREVIGAVLDAVPRHADRGRRHRRTVVEVGVESGAASAMYVELGADRVYCVEPAPTDALRADLAARAGLRLVERASPAVLDELPVADVYVLDGDHNHATVLDEVGWIMRNAPDAVVLLHDVLWPCGRRDLYYQPSHVDPARRHPCSADGPTVRDDGLSPDGFVGAGSFRVAAHAGGERNGVLTAVEDCMATAGQPWSLEIVPAVFGLGILVRDRAPAARVVRARTAPWTGSHLLADLEGNRIALYSRVLELQQVAVRAGEEVAALRAELAAARSAPTAPERPPRPRSPRHFSATAPRWALRRVVAGLRTVRRRRAR